MITNHIMKINVIWVIFNIKKFMKLEINSIIDKGEYKGKKVSKILSNDKKCIFRLIKEGLMVSWNIGDEMVIRFLIPFYVRFLSKYKSLKEILKI